MGLGDIEAEITCVLILFWGSHVTKYASVSFRVGGKEAGLTVASSRSLLYFLFHRSPCLFPCQWFYKQMLLPCRAETWLGKVPMIFFPC